MADRQRNKNGNSDLQEERTKRQERAERILDAAARLILRWGYKKTTVDDIARHAGVAKGTIYLHWKTREDLFQALWVREYLAILEEFRQHLVSNPESATLHGITRQAILLLMTHPLIKAMMLGDTDVLGELADREFTDPTSVTQRRFEIGKLYLEVLRSKGLMRTDMSMQVQMHMLLATGIGFLMTERFSPDEFKLPPEQAAEMLAETIRRTLEPVEAIPPEKVQEVHTIFLQIITQLINAVRERSQKEIE